MDGIAIRSTGEWRRFVSTLQYHGLVSKKELLILDKMWADIMEVAVATGVGRDGKGGALVTFEEFTERLLRLYDVPRDKVIQKTINSLTQQVHSLSSLFKEWQIETLNEIQMKQLLLSVDALCEQHERVEAEVHHHADHQVSLMTKQHVQTLFWDEVGGPGRSSEACAMRAERTSLLFQQNKSGLIGRTCRKRKIRSIRAIRFPATGSNPRLNSKKDLMGHAADCHEGVSCNIGKTVGEDGKIFVEVVTVPRGPLSSKILQSVLDVYSAHRQLTLCPEIPNVLGIDDCSSEEEIYYFYSFAPGGITASELISIGGPLHETQPLFRFIAGKILNAFIALDEQCTFGLTKDISLENIIVADVGTQILLGKLPLGNEISPFGNATESKVFHDERENRLVKNFGRIISDLLMGLPGSGRESSAKRREQRRMVDDGDDRGCRPGETGLQLEKVYGKEACEAGIHVGVKDRFTIQLMANTMEGFAWHHPHILVSDRNKPFPVKLIDVSSKNVVGGLTQFNILMEAMDVGSCMLELTCNRPWEPLPKEPTLVIQAAVHGEGLSPAMDAVIRACVDGIPAAIISKAGSKPLTFVDSFREEWERQPMLREIARLDLFDIGNLNVDSVFADFEGFVDAAP